MLTKLQIPTLLLFTVAVYGQTPESRIPVLSPGVHNQRLPRTGERTIQYAPDDLARLKSAAALALD